MAAAQPIVAVKFEGLGFPVIEHVPEDGAETFLRGTPVFLDTDGMANPVTTSFGGTEIIYGISMEPAHNLTTQNTAQSGNEHGAPQNQTSAVTTAIGSPVVTGKIAVVRPNQQTTFRAALTDGQNYTDALKSGTVRYELALESNGYWSVDSTDTGTGADHVVHIVGPDPTNDEFVYIKFFVDKVAA